MGFPNLGWEFDSPVPHKFMFKLEKVIINPDYSDNIKAIFTEHETEITESLEDLTKSLGQGNTADVRFLELDNLVCLKIYKKSEQVPDGIYYVSPEKEREFLENLQNLDTKVRVPKIYASFEIDQMGELHRFIMMEALNAVSVDDVLQNRATLPKDFDWISFEKDLLDFAEKIHERGIYHRDLHEGNIMIDKDTLQAYVIDFGASSEFWGSIEPGERGPYHITKDGVERILTSDEGMIRSVVKKLRTKLTNM